MLIILIQVLGVFIFITGALILGKWIRQNPDKKTAEKASRVNHFLFFTCILFPGVIGILYPGLTRYDEIIGIKALPFRSQAFIFGGVLLLLGIYFLMVSNMTLIKLGKGTAAFKLTKHLVEGSIYKKVRNPMALGFYLLCIGIGLMAGSTSITLGSLGIIIPAHIFNLKYFEERELEIRYSKPYVRYKQNVPFLIPRLISRLISMNKL